MHARGQIRPRFSEQDDHATCHVFAQKASRIAADDDGRRLLAVFLHVDAHAPTAAVAHQNATAAHAVARRIAHAAMDDNVAIVHGVGNLILRVAENLYLAAVHVASHIVAGHAVNLEALSGRHTAAQIALGESIAELDDVVFLKSGTHGRIALGEMHRAQCDHRAIVTSLNDRVGCWKAFHLRH